MSEKNFESINEQEIAELYGDILEEPLQIAGWVEVPDDGCARGTVCTGTPRKVAGIWNCYSGYCRVCDDRICKRD